LCFVRNFADSDKAVIKFGIEFIGDRERICKIALVDLYNYDRLARKLANTRTAEIDARFSECTSHNFECLRRR